MTRGIELQNPAVPCTQGRAIGVVIRSCRAVLRPPALVRIIFSPENPYLRDQSLILKIPRRYPLLVSLAEPPLTREDTGLAIIISGTTVACAHSAPILD